jgi:hypothetical protein
MLTSAQICSVHFTHGAQEMRTKFWLENPKEMRSLGKPKHGCRLIWLSET